MMKKKKTMKKKKKKTKKKKKVLVTRSLQLLVPAEPCLNVSVTTATQENAKSFFIMEARGTEIILNHWLHVRTSVEQNQTDPQNLPHRWTLYHKTCSVGIQHHCSRGTMILSNQNIYL